MHRILLLSLSLSALASLVICLAPKCPTFARGPNPVFTVQAQGKVNWWTSLAGGDAAEGNTLFKWWQDGDNAFQVKFEFTHLLFLCLTFILQAYPEADALSTFMNSILEVTVTQNANHRELFVLSHDKSFEKALKKKLAGEQFQVDPNKLNSLIQHENAWETMIIAINDQMDNVFTFSKAEKRTREAATDFNQNIPPILDDYSMPNLDAINKYRAPGQIQEKLSSKTDKNKVFAHTKVMFRIKNLLFPTLYRIILLTSTTDSAGHLQRWNRISHRPFIPQYTVQSRNSANGRSMDVLQPYCRAFQTNAARVLFQFWYAAIPFERILYEYFLRSCAVTEYLECPQARYSESFLEQPSIGGIFFVAKSTMASVSQRQRLGYERLEI